MSEQEKFPVWKITGNLTNPEFTEWIVPVHKIVGFENLGGGDKGLLGYIESQILDGLDVFMFDDGDAFNVELVFLTKEQLKEIQIYD